MMGRFVPRERELEVDLESGGKTSEEDTMSDPISANGQTKKLLKRAWTGPVGFHGLVNSSNFGEIAAEDVELLMDKNSEGEEGQQNNIAFVDRKDFEEKHIKKNLRKPPKPPRPPRGLSLDAADQKLMKEITELAMRKRARIERLKALKKMRAAKASSWSSSLSAMFITIVFCLIIIYQAPLSRFANIITTVHLSWRNSGLRRPSLPIIGSHLTPYQIRRHLPLFVLSSRSEQSSPPLLSSLSSRNSSMQATDFSVSTTSVGVWLHQCRRHLSLFVLSFRSKQSSQPLLSPLSNRNSSTQATDFSVSTTSVDVWLHQCLKSFLSDLPNQHLCSNLICELFPLLSHASTSDTLAARSHQIRATSAPPYTSAHISLFNPYQHHVVYIFSSRNSGS